MRSEEQCSRSEIHAKKSPSAEVAPNETLGGLKKTPLGAIRGTNTQA